MRKLVLATFVVLIAALPALSSALAAPTSVGRYLLPVREDGAVFGPDGQVVRAGTGYDANGCRTDTPPKSPKTNPAGHECLPAGATVIQLADGRVLYWNALEGFERMNQVVLEIGKLTVNDLSRTMTIRPNGSVSWATPTPPEGGVHNTEHPDDLPLGPLSAKHYAYNNGSLFCAAQVQLADGRILVTGGTDYYSEPNIPGADLGPLELQGLRHTRIFDPSRNRWTAAGQMNDGRWYPGLVTLADGRIFVASGVTKLIKPAYPTHPLDSGRNVIGSETYDPATAKWTGNGPGGERSLPLFPRLHLLPNGHVYYDSAGQVYNPAGQAYDEALTWNTAASYDPTTRTWHDLGTPGGMTNPMGGFRGSTFSTPLPLRPARNGSYGSASFLTGGGVLFPTPGSVIPVADSRIDTVSVAGGAEKLTSITTGPMGQARWYTSGVALPDGTVYAAHGATVDQVVAPGAEVEILKAEVFTPLLDKNGEYAGGRWRPAGEVARKRSYHNTAMLLPDGRVLLGGNAPIPTADTAYIDRPDLPGMPGTNNRHDPSFQIYEPPYWGKARPSIAGVDHTVTRGTVLRVKTRNAATIAQVVLMRNTAQTHLVDGDARTVSVPIVARHQGAVDVLIPASAAVLPAGPYLLFINQNKGNVHDDAPGHVVPSKGAQVMVVG
jgi:hypothetical protein